MARYNDLIIGLTTFNHEFLNISIPGLGRIGKNTTLIIYNDNPCRKITRRKIRRLGYRGKLYIINSGENVGQIRARIAILDLIKKSKISGDWFMFANDDDIILNTRVPDVDENNFAVMGNAVVVRSRILDVLRVMENPMDFTIDGVDITLIAPSVNMAGTFVRTSHIIGYGNCLAAMMDKVLDIVSDAPFHIPVDVIMWAGFVEYMRRTNPEMSPIYMNQTNYLMIKLNSTRYASTDQCTGMTNKFLSIFINI